MKMLLVFAVLFLPAVRSRSERKGIDGLATIIEISMVKIHLRRERSFVLREAFRSVQRALVDGNRIPASI